MLSASAGYIKKIELNHLPFKYKPQWPVTVSMPHFQANLEDHSAENAGTALHLTCGRKCGPIRQLPSIPTQTLNEKDC